MPEAGGRPVQTNTPEEQACKQRRRRALVVCRVPEEEDCRVRKAQPAQGRRSPARRAPALHRGRAEGCRLVQGPCRARLGRRVCCTQAPARTPQVPHRREERRVLGRRQGRERRRGLGRRQERGHKPELGRRKVQGYRQECMQVAGRRREQLVHRVRQGRESNHRHSGESEKTETKLNCHSSYISYTLA
jgi:hypothetical protein